MIIAVLLVLMFLQTTSSASAVPTVMWAIDSNSSPYQDEAYAVCELGNYVYVVGYDEEQGNAEFRVEMRSKENGSLVKVWRRNPSNYVDKLVDCVIVNEKLYVIGFDSVPGDYEWAVLIFSPALELLKYVAWNPSNGTDKAFAVVSDGTYLYIAGVDSVHGDLQWRIEKRTSNTLELINVYTSNPSLSDDYVYSVGVDLWTNEVWLVGNNHTKWHIEILSRDLELLKAIGIDMDGSARYVVFDNNGNAYVVGDYGEVKLNEHGHVSWWWKRRYSSSYKALFNRGFIYLAGVETIGGFSRHVLYALNKDHEFVTKLTLSIDVDLSAVFNMGKMCSDGERIYVAGAVKRNAEDYGWRVYAISLGPPTVSHTTTRTRTAWATNTKTITLTTTAMRTRNITRTVTRSTTLTRYVTSLATAIVVLRTTETSTHTLTKKTLEMLYTRVTLTTSFIKTLTDVVKHIKTLLQTKELTETTTTTLTSVITNTKFKTITVPILSLRVLDIALILSLIFVIAAVLVSLIRRRS